MPGVGIPEDVEFAAKQWQAQMIVDDGGGGAVRLVHRG